MEIRRAAYSDKPAVFEFLKAAYTGRSEFKFPHRWAWAFEDNPFLVDDQPPVWIAVAPDGRVVGQSAALVEPLVVHGRAYRVGWGVDFFVLPEYRGQGLGTQLQAANNAAAEVFMSLSMAQGAAAIKSRLGMSALPDVPQFTRILNHDIDSVRQTLQRRFPGLPFLGAAAPLAARFLTRRGAPPPFVETRGIQIRQETNFTEAFDRLWEQLSGSFTALVRRDARYLTWKYRQQPHMQYDIFGAYRDGSLAGYAILRRARPPERSAGILADLFARPDDAGLIGALLDHTVTRFFKQGVTYITAASSVPEICSSLLERHFKLTKNITPLVRAPFQVPEAGWLLARADHDWDQYPHA